jgi:HAD superfamily hydrolase (TIGR01549 family)
VITTVLFDIGETLMDETQMWERWARFLDVPAFTLFGVIGGLAATGRNHQEFAQLLRGRTFEDLRAEFVASGLPLPALGEQDLYPDAVPCLKELRARGWRIVVGGNQPATFQRLVEELELPVDAVTSSGELGFEKPSIEFFRGMARVAGVECAECVHVGDRVDNDVVGALRAGMTVVHLRRGPWGYLHADDPALADPSVHQLDTLADLPDLLARIR